MSLVTFFLIFVFVFTYFEVPCSVSPFLADDVASLKWMTVPPRRCMAAVNEKQVRVLTSKNMDAITLP